MKALLSVIMTVSLLSFGALACGGEEEENAESADPIMGLMEFPISHRTEPALSNAIRIEASPSKLRVDGRTVAELEGGHLPEGARTGDDIAPLAAAIAGGPARRSAELSLHANIPYITTALILSTLKSANVNEVAFAVRTVGEPNAGFIVLGDFQTRTEAQELFEFPDSHMPAWGQVATHWEAMYTACRVNHYVDCAFKPQNIAEGGKTHITFFVRGNGVKVELTRVGEPPPDPNAGAQVEMLDGVPSAEDQEVEEPPAVYAAFTWRYNATTDAESPVSATMRPLCGAASCGVLVTAEAQTQTMRILSFIGAAFPTGTEAPKTVFQIPPPM